MASAPTVVHMPSFPLSSDRPQKSTLEDHSYRKKVRFSSEDHKSCLLGAQHYNTVRRRTMLLFYRATSYTTYR